MRKKILVADDSQTALMMEIILDVVMPCMDGFEACRELRRLDATRAIPVIGGIVGATA